MSSEGSDTSSAVWFEGPRQAALRQMDVPKPDARQVTIRAMYSLVSAGSEMNFYRGETALDDLLMPTTRGTLPFPISFGYQTVGVVEAAGAESGFVPGEVVLARHPHQSRFTVRPEDALLVRVPAGYDPLKAVFATLFSVALQTLLIVPVRPGDCVVVSGLGLVGTFTAFLARKTAARLIVVDPDPSRRARASWLGADFAVAPGDLDAAVNEATAGRGVDVFVESSGAPPAMQAAIRSTGMQGTIAVSAWYGTRPVTMLLSPEFHLRSQRMISCVVRNLPGDLASRWSHQRRAATSLELLSAIDVRHLVSHRFDFASAPEAYQLIDSGPGEVLGVVLVHSQ